MGTTDIIGPDAGRQPVGIVIGQTDNVRVLIKCLSGEHRSKNFLLNHRHGLINASQYCRLQEIARQRLNGITAGHQLSALLTSSLDPPAYRLKMFPGDKRTHFACGVMRWTDLVAGRNTRKTVQNFIINRCFHVEAGARDADLPGVGKNSLGSSGYRLIQIRVCEHNHRRFAPQL